MANATVHQGMQVSWQWQDPPAGTQKPILDDENPQGVCINSR